MSDSNANHTSPASPRIGSIIVVGIVREIEKSFDKDFQRLSKAFGKFSSIDWHVVESGSRDASVAVLEDYTKKLENFSFQHLEHQSTLSRTENMAIARNAYLDYLRADSRLDNYEYVIMADFDNLNNRLTAKAVESCFGKDSWDIVTANQKGRYYDAWALRHPLWSPNDCWEQHAFYRKYTKFPESAITFSMRSRMLKIPKNSDWVEVDSAFGGLAIYKAATLRVKASYAGATETGSITCEHVSFHLALRMAGAKIFINPALINTKTTDHSRRLSVAYTCVRILLYPFKSLKKLSNG